MIGVAGDVTAVEGDLQFNIIYRKTTAGHGEGAFPKAAYILRTRRKMKNAKTQCYCQKPFHYRQYSNKTGLENVKL
jgi:hypothetical protein